MKRNISITGKIVIVLMLALLCMGIWGRAYSRNSGTFSTAKLTPQLSEIFRWLPADTEAVTVTQSPTFLSSVEDWREPEPGYFTQRMTTLLGVLPAQSWADKVKLNLVVTGSRNFRPPTSLGVFWFDGCSILRFAKDSPVNVQQFIERADKDCDCKVVMNGVSVYCFKKKMMDDNWTFYLYPLSPDIVLWASDKNYLHELLIRQRASVPQQAFLPDSALWENIDTKSEFFGMRNVRKVSGEQDLYSIDRIYDAQGNEHKDESPLGYSVCYKAKTSLLVEEYLSNDKVAQKYREYWHKLALRTCNDINPYVVSSDARMGLKITTDIRGGTAEARYTLPLRVIVNLGHNFFI